MKKIFSFKSMFKSKRAKDEKYSQQSFSQEGEDMILNRIFGNKISFFSFCSRYKLFVKIK